MLYLSSGLRSVNLRGLCRRHLPEEKRVALAVDTRLGLLQPTGFRTRDVCSLYGVSARAVNAGLHDWAAANGVVDVANGKGGGTGNGTGNGTSHGYAEFAETLKTMSLDELAASFKIAGPEVIWGALVRAL